MKNLIQKIVACETHATTTRIANALLWAAVILITSWLSRGSENADAVFIMIISLAAAAFLVTDRQQGE